MEHLSSDMEQQQNQQVQWRRDKVQELYSKGYSQREISQTLQVGLATVNRDISYLRDQAKTNIKRYIDEEDSVLDKRQKIYYPLVELHDKIDEGREEQQEKIRNCLTSDGVDNFMQYSKLIVPKNCTNIHENWLKFEILCLMKYPLQVEKFSLLDKHDNELCICRFEKEYEKTMKWIFFQPSKR
jgi:transposase